MRAPAIWLRDNCHCPECRHPGSGQKLFGITDLPEHVTVEDEWDSGTDVQVRFSDGHVGVLPRGLATTDGPPADDRAEDAKRTWTAAELGAPPSADWTAYRTDPDVRIAALSSVLRTGFVLLHGIPVRERQVLEVAAGFGFVRRTNYGELFDVRVEDSPVNLAFTSLPIAPHTDDPYRDPVPTLQLLHCLSNAADGGDSGLVDGFRHPADDRRRPVRPDPRDPVQQSLAPAGSGTRRHGAVLRRVSGIRHRAAAARTHAHHPTRAR
jgi:gamma-butyrobetaine dioxygenase